VTLPCPSPWRQVHRAATLALLLTIFRPLDVCVEGVPNLRQAQPVVECTATQRPARTIAVGRRPIALALDAQTRRAFVRNGDGTVSVLDRTHDTVLRTITVSAPAAHPVEGLVTNHNADARCLFVPISYEEPAANPQSGTVSVVDVATARVLTTIPIGGLLLSATVDPTTGQVLILNHNDPANPRGPNGSVSVLGARPPSDHDSGGA
jgi:DNA-binding beta-propeller fold protein YncE